MNEKVSIILPVYNTGVFLKDTISDIIHQTYALFELICVNDGSTDDSAKVLGYFAGLDDRIKVIHKENGGGASARNVGLEAVTGDYVIFLDSDDRFDPHLLEYTVKKAKATNIDIVAFGGDDFDTSTGLMLEDEFSQSVLNMDLIIDKDIFSYRDCPDNIFQFCAPLTSNKLYRTDFIRETGIRYQEIPYNDDSYFACINTVLAERIAVVDKKLFTYRNGNRNSNSKYLFRRDKPQYNFEMFLAIREKLVELGKLEEVWQSLAKMAASQVLYHINAVTEDNYQVFDAYYDDGFIEKMRINRLTSNDFKDEDYYNHIKCLCEKGWKGYLCRWWSGQVDYEDSVNFQSIIQRSEEGNTDEKFFFDIGRIPTGSGVVLYGAGKKGQWIYEMNKKTGKYDFVAWVDKNADRIGEIDGIKIQKPEAIVGINFDYVILGVGATRVDLVEEITEELSSFVDKEKIVW